MKCLNSEIQFADLHFERLFNALNILQFELPENFSAAYLREQIFLLCKKNNLHTAARVRLNFFRKTGGLYDPIDHTPDFIIETSELPAGSLVLNANGLIVDVYNEARKSCDAFSNLKCNNYLPYLMGALFAKQNKLDDCLILNMHDRICEATIANVFWIKNNIIHTPPLSEGCVAGIMRRRLLCLLPKHGYSVQEKPLSTAELKEADELFLTNAVSGIRWVKAFQKSEYTKAVIESIYSLLS